MYSCTHLSGLCALTCVLTSDSDRAHADPALVPVYVRERRRRHVRARARREQADGVHNGAAARLTSSASGARRSLRRRRRFRRAATRQVAERAAGARPAACAAVRLRQCVSHHSLHAAAAHFGALISYLRLTFDLTCVSPADKCHLSSEWRVVSCVSK